MNRCVINDCKKERENSLGYRVNDGCPGKYKNMFALAVVFRFLTKKITDTSEFSKVGVSKCPNTLFFVCVVVLELMAWNVRMSFSVILSMCKINVSFYSFIW